MTTMELRSERRLAGSLLILGTVLFFAGLAALFLGANFMAFLEAPPDAPLQPLLANLAEDVASWQWGWALLIAAVVTTALGLAMLTSVLREAGDRTLSWLGLIAFLLGAVLWVTDMAYDLSVTVWVAQNAARGSAEPEFYAPLILWGETLAGIYNLLAFLAMAAYGAAILHTRLLPRWVGWAAIVWSVVWLGMYLLTLSAPPVLHQVMPLLIGIMLLLRRNQVPVGLGEEGGATNLRIAANREGLSR
jgi:hypothetical protein